ncbi:MAG TPA: AMP-binding protein, partial [Solirubrobacteraceae bacterium]|nr:AMP-binding protein [Solirubrobacteraceae bacterium]
MNVGSTLHTARTLIGAGVFRPERPDKLLHIVRALRRWGPTLAAGYAAGAARTPHEPAIIDELGTLTFGDVHRRTNALAHAFADQGIKEGDGVAVLVRNHRGFVETIIALSKLGANSLLLNTAFAGPQITEVMQREKAIALVYDEEFTELVAEGGRRRKRFVAWFDGGEGAPDDPLIEDLIAQGDPDDVVPPIENGKVIILTSGTTGSPKGANRKQPETLNPAAALLSRIPLHAGETTHIAAPLFHSWGFFHFVMSLPTASTIVL